MYGLGQQDIDIIQSIGKNYANIKRILIFGSRVLEKYRKASDVDLAVMGGLEPKDIWAISGQLNDELPTPYFYDVVHFESLLDEKMKTHIRTEGKIIYESEAP